MSLRTGLGLALVALLLALLWLDTLWPRGYVFAVAGTVVLTVALREFAGLVRAAGGQVRTPVLTVGGASVFLLSWAGWARPGAYPDPWLSVVAGVCVMLTAVFAGRIGRSRVEGSLQALGSTMAGLLYLPVMFGFLTAVRLHTCGGEAPAWGVLGLFTTIAVCKAGSAGAYFVGKTLGKHPMAPVVSPNKTLEGAAGALVGSVLVSLALNLPSWGLLEPGWAVIFGLMVGLAGMLGDLAASLLKREAGLKDSGRLLPGFGGMIDMLDDILFAAPVAFFLLVAAECL
jgi:phosphatidate cytidylyltransferase